MNRQEILALLNGRDLSDIHPNRRPRKAASLLLWRGRPDNPEILMGKRNKNLKFMPGKFVFPGGAVERADGQLKPAQRLDDLQQKRIGESAQALAMASIRECFEETGLRAAAQSAPVSRSSIWQEYTKPGLRPDLSQLVFLARAITPPNRIRRFDTFFFGCEADGDTSHLPLDDASSEILDLMWIKLENAHDLDVAFMTRAILEEVKTNLFHPKSPRPFYRVKNGEFTCSDIP